MDYVANLQVPGSPGGEGPACCAHVCCSAACLSPGQPPGRSVSPFLSHILHCTSFLCRILTWETRPCTMVSMMSCTLY